MEDFFFLKKPSLTHRGTYTDTCPFQNPRHPDKKWRTFFLKKKSLTHRGTYTNTCPFQNPRHPDTPRTSAPASDPPFPGPPCGPGKKKLRKNSQKSLAYSTITMCNSLQNVMRFFIFIFLLIEGKKWRAFF